MKTLSYGLASYSVDVHHPGFQVETLEETAESITAAGYELRHDIEIARGLRADPRKDNAEYKYKGRDGIIVDVSEPRPGGSGFFHRAGRERAKWKTLQTISTVN